MIPLEWFLGWREFALRWGISKARPAVEVFAHIQARLQSAVPLACPGCGKWPCEGSGTTCSLTKRTRWNGSLGSTPRTSRVDCEKCGEPATREVRRTGGSMESRTGSRDASPVVCVRLFTGADR